MGMVFRPSVRKGGEFFGLPGPISKFQVQDAWDYERYKVLLEAGDGTVGISRNGVDITIQGEVGSVDGEPMLSEVEMLETLEALRSALDATDEELLDFFIYRDDEAEEYRYFRQCSVSRFRYELSRPELYEYSLILHADDPVMQTT